VEADPLVIIFDAAAAAFSDGKAFSAPPLLLPVGEEAVDKPAAG